MTRYLPAFITYTLLTAFFLAGSPLHDFPLDDAWIHRVYAESVAAGQGLCYNTGTYETGSTSPLWVILTAWVHWLPADTRAAPALYTKCFAFLLGLLVIRNVQRIALLLTRSRLAETAAGVLFAFNSILYFSVGSGMENLLLLVLLTLAFEAWLTDRRELTCLLCGLAVITRPEAAIFALAIVPPALYHIGKQKGIRHTLVTALGTTSAPVIWLSFCLLVTGHPLPQTFYIKAQATAFAPLTFGRDMLRSLTLYGLPATPLFSLGILLFLWKCLRKGIRQRLPAIAFIIGLPLLYLTGVLLSRPLDFSGYYWTRWLEPPLQLLSVASVIGLACCLAASEKNNRPAIIILSLAIAASLPFLIDDFFERKSRYTNDARNIHALNVSSGLWLHQNTAPSAIVGLHDAGAIRFFSQRRCLDFAGLNHAPAAFGNVSFQQLIDQCDWLAVFPAVFAAGNRLKPLQQHFTPATAFIIPPEDYTIAKVSKPIVQIIYHRPST
jgi:hypothetical protein